MLLRSAGLASIEADSFSVPSVPVDSVGMGGTVAVGREVGVDITVAMGGTDLPGPTVNQRTTAINKTATAPLPTHHQVRSGAVETDACRGCGWRCARTLLAEGSVRRFFRFFLARLLFLDIEAPRCDLVRRKRVHAGHLLLAPTAWGVGRRNAHHAPRLFEKGICGSFTLFKRTPYINHDRRAHLCGRFSRARLAPLW